MTVEDKVGWSIALVLILIYVLILIGIDTVLKRREKL